MQRLVIHYLHIAHLIPQKKKHYLCGEDCRKNFCKDLRVHATEIINYEKKKGNFVIIMTMTKSITVIKLENIELLHIICII